MSASRIGGKAAGLEALREAGVRVPHFAVVPAELESGDGAALERWLSGAGLSFPVAVRSSADVEDSESASYAGMFETRLGVASPPALADAVAAVAGGSSKRLAAYAASRGDHREPRVHVVVQQMVDARCAGVCLVRPVEAPDSIRVEAVRGVGHTLVAGEAEPDAFVLAAADLALRTRRRGTQYVEMAGDGTRRALPSSQRARWKLGDSELQEVATLARDLDRRFGFAGGTELEWALDGGGTLYALQVRPLAVTG